MEYEDEDAIELLDGDDDDCVEIPFMFKIRQGHARIPGNEVIVAISEYGKLMFWSVTTGADTAASALNSNYDDLERTGRFEPLAEVCMDEPGLEYDKVSKKLAIDPHSRAIAVASLQDRFDIMILRDIMSRTNFSPIIGMGKVMEEGIIWHMEFLHTETTSRDRILLALIVYSDVDHQCRIIVYSIDASNANDIEIERIGRLPLDTSTPVPILLVPLRHYPEALVLLTEYEAGIVTTDDIACGNLLYPTCPIERPFGEVKCPLFTAYAHCLGNIEPSTSTAFTKYYIYLGADDGSLFRMLFPSRHEIRWEILDPVNAVAPAMSLLGTLLVEDETVNDKPQAYLADVLFYAGEGADSQILAIDQSTHSTRAHVVLQTLTNRAPIVDSQLATVMADEQNAIISCSGQANHGALTVVSRGVQTSLLQKLKIRWEGFTRLWNTQARISESTIAPVLVASSVLETKLMLIQDDELSDVTDSAGIDARQGTVAAGFVNVVKQSKTNVTRVPIFVQICKDGILLIDNVKNGHVVGHWSPKAHNAERIHVITLATIIQSDAYPSQIIICLSDGCKHTLLPLDLVYEDQSITLSPLLGAISISEPSFIHHFTSS
ncbi:mono-functional DNA-alkylating methyl methanesulfonate N-term-domain-containing protein [Zychaea mexicana]|uniref:mono-functional DNA-alkylating methyl methanesulfonate N-term-domain-containing protein n=1 Tax=Zychaea mexicana TaxID=64656 RepID=UPI0022FDFE3B|nr:mono-functional DNA-alkylating methyl methanesulfonate N-term-domain-containing protein [Zychaea mexicana]KAI9498543.1 mono-functional DNA-alkylating methyl methanesulfonate N-term-domain-containing protein [Zychaea mexicana]